MSCRMKNVSLAVRSHSTVNVLLVNTPLYTHSLTMLQYLSPYLTLLFAWYNALISIQILISTDRKADHEAAV